MTGVLLGFQARLPAQVVPQSALWYLAAFAVTLGLSEWIKMAVLVPRAAGQEVELIGVVIGALSYLFLVQFAVEFYGRRRQWSRWMRTLVPSLLLASFALIVALVTREGLDDASLRTIEAASRYALGLP